MKGSMTNSKQHWQGPEAWGRDDILFPAIGPLATQPLSTGQILKTHVVSEWMNEWMMNE